MYFFSYITLRQHSLETQFPHTHPQKDRPKPSHTPTMRAFLVASAVSIASASVGQGGIGFGPSNLGWSADGHMITAAVATAVHKYSVLLNFPAWLLLLQQLLLLV